MAARTSVQVKHEIVVHPRRGAVRLRTITVAGILDGGRIVAPAGPRGFADANVRWRLA